MAEDSDVSLSSLSDNQESDTNSMDNDDSCHEQQEGNKDNGEQEHSGAADVAPKSPKFERVEGGFWCATCNKTIKGAPQKFKRHYDEMHGPDSSDKLFRCGRCKRTYKSARSLTTHRKNLHKHEYKRTPDVKKNKRKKKGTDKQAQPQSAKEIKVGRFAKPPAAAAAATGSSTSEFKPFLKRQTTIDLTGESPIKKKIKEEPNPKLNQDENVVTSKQNKESVKSNAKEDQDIIEDDSELVEAEEQAKIELAQAEAEMNVRKEMIVSREEANDETAMDYVIAQQKAAMDYAISQQKAKNKIRTQAALAVVEDRGKGKLAKAREELDKIQRKVKEKSTLRKRAVTADLSGDDDDDDDDDDDAQPKKKRNKQNVIDDNDDEEEAERMDDDNLPIMVSNNTVPQSPMPEVIQISGPHLNDIQAGNDPFASIPTNYDAADNVLKQKFAAAAAATGRTAGAAGGTGASSMSEFERLDRLPMVLVG